jgi:NarL family two-component system response regulator LiaR
VGDPIRILIVDDHTVVRHGLRLMLELKPGLDVVGEAQDGSEAISQARLLQPDVILMDLEMPRMSGLQAIEEIHPQFPNIHILVLTSYADSEKIAMTIKAGAAGYLLKDSSPKDLVEAIQNVYHGNISLPPEIAQKLVQGLQQPSKKSPSDTLLTGREKEIIQLAANGLSNVEIAQKLVLSEGTVRFHFSNIFSKLHVSNRSQAILFALRQGWVDLNDST